MLYWHFGYRNPKVPKALIDFSPIENKGIVNEKPPKPIRIGMKAFLFQNGDLRMSPQRKELIMAETSEGKKKVYVHSHTKEDGTEVRTHYRSTPNTSTGKKSK